MSGQFPKKVVLFLLNILLLLAFPASVYAGSVIGSPFTVTSDPKDESEPSVAYNSVRQEYLVVWCIWNSGNSDLIAQRLTKDGAKIGEPFYIATGFTEGSLGPEIAYDWTHDQYLVVWRNFAIDGDSIQGRLISGTGELLGTGNIVIKAAADNYDQLVPAIEYAYTDDCFMVVWTQRTRPEPLFYTIYAQAVTPTGALGLLTEISSGEEYRGRPDIAYNRHMNRHLVVWEEYDETNSVMSIRAQQIHGDGETYLSEFGFDALDIYDCYNPAIASIPTAPTDVKFVLVFERKYDADKEIYGVFIEEDGDVVGDITLGTPGNDDVYPSIAGNEVGQEYLISWQEDLGIDGQVLHLHVIPSAHLKWSSHYEILENDAGVAVITAGYLSDFFLVWNDIIPERDYDIYGLLYGNRSFLPFIVD